MTTVPSYDAILADLSRVGRNTARTKTELQNLREQSSSLIGNNAEIPEARELLQAAEALDRKLEEFALRTAVLTARVHADSGQSPPRLERVLFPVASVASLKGWERFLRLGQDEETQGEDGSEKIRSIEDSLWEVLPGLMLK